jgi:hypothetical protein
MNRVRHRHVKVVMARLASLAALVGALAIAVGGTAHAQPSTLSPTPCVNRGGGLVRPVQDIEIYPGSLQYCTGADCWSFDLATRTVAALPGYVPAVAKPSLDPAGTFTDGHGTTLAIADEAHVEFCPKSIDARASCQSFKFKIETPAASVRPQMNDARTLGTVVYRGEGDNDPHVWLLAFNLTARRRVAMLEGSSIRPLDHGFWVDHEMFYSPMFKKVARLAARDEVWVKLGSTDRIALRDTEKGDIVLQSTTTGKALRISHGAPDPAVWFALVASPDAKTLYAIGSVSDEGEVLVIDVAKAKIVARATPPLCAAGTHRLQ